MISRRNLLRGAGILIGLSLFDRPEPVLAGFGSIARPHLLALMYHRLGTQPADYQIGVTAFEAQLDLLAERGYRGVTMEQVIAYGRGDRLLPARSVLVSFDDNYLTMMQDQALPAVKRVWERTGVCFPLVWAVVTGTRDWTHFSTDAFSWIRRQEQAGWLDVQSHTVTHPALTELIDQPDRLHFELTESRLLLEERISGEVEIDIPGDGGDNQRIVPVTKRVSTLVLPYGEGARDSAVMEAALSAGYECVLSASPSRPFRRVMLRGDSLLPVGRIGVGGQGSGILTVDDLAQLLDEIGQRHSFSLEECLLVRKLFEPDR